MQLDADSANESNKENRFIGTTKVFMNLFLREESVLLMLLKPTELELEQET